LDVLFEILAEFLLEVFFEVLVSLGFDALAQALGLRPTDNQLVALFGCLLVGLIFGALSLGVHAQRLISDNVLAGLALVSNPVLVGVALSQVGRWRLRRGASITALATFWGGFCFALGFGGVRFAWSFL
jgi:hypothetical protein